MSRTLALAVVFVHAAAWADSLAPEQQPPISRFSLTYGLDTSGARQHVNGLDETFGGSPTPNVIHFSGAWFLKRWFGLALDLDTEFFGIQGSLAPNTTAHTELTGYGLSLEAVGRWSPRFWLGLELHLGLNIGGWPGFTVEGATVRSSQIGHGGPVGALVVAIEPDSFVGGLISFRGSPLSVTSFGSHGDFDAGWYALEGQLFLGNLAIVGNWRGALVVDLELTGAGGNTTDKEVSFQQVQGRASLGVRLRQQSPPPPTPTGLAAGHSKVHVHVLADGRGVRATLEVPGQGTLATDVDGALDLEGLDGTLTLKAVAEGYKPATQEISAARGVDSTVTFTLAKPTGPGTIRGTVRGEKPDAPIEGAEISIEGKIAAHSAADGAFKIDSVGPGPVKVQVKAKGFANGEDVVQVPPEADATVALVLSKQGDKALATIRGLVRTASGKAVKATVRINELNLKVAVKPDGRFVVQVPGGKYTLIIEAAGFVSQAKPLDVADGDQAIFHCDLQPTTR